MRTLAVYTVVVSSVAGFALADTKEAATESSVTIIRSAPCPTVPNPPGCGAPNWINLLSTTITPPGGKDLFITFSSVVGLFTLGANTASGAAANTFTAEDASLLVRVLVDGTPLAVGSQVAIAFDTLFRSTTATLAGIVSSVNVSCTNEVDIGPLAGVITCSATVNHSTTPSVLDTVLDETGVRAFSWVAKDVGVGTHTITVQGQFTALTSPAASALNNAAVVVGARTLTIDQAQLDGH